MAFSKRYVLVTSWLNHGVLCYVAVLKSSQVESNGLSMSLSVCARIHGSKPFHYENKRSGTYVQQGWCNSGVIH